MVKAARIEAVYASALARCSCGNWHEEDEERCMREFIARASTGYRLRVDSRRQVKSLPKEVSIVVTAALRRQLFSCRSTIAWRDAACGLLDVVPQIALNGPKSSDAVESFEDTRKLCRSPNRLRSQTVAVGDCREAVCATLELLAQKPIHRTFLCERPTLRRLPRAVPQGAISAAMCPVIITNSIGLYLPPPQRRQSIGSSDDASNL